DEGQCPDRAGPRARFLPARTRPRRRRADPPGRRDRARARPGRLGQGQRPVRPRHGRRGGPAGTRDTGHPQGRRGRGRRGAVAAGTALVLDQVVWPKATAQSVNGMADEAALPAPVTPATAKGAAVEVAGVLSLLSTRVLGQFDPFAEEAGRLMFVAPAVLIAEEAMNVDARDFRMWVALHEATHQVQFATAP